MGVFGKSRALLVAYFYVCVFNTLFQGLPVAVKGCVERVCLDGAAIVEDLCGLSPTGLLGSVGRSGVRQGDKVTIESGNRGIEQSYWPAWS